MKEHPILFSTSMVQAILAGQKTQTRRIVNPQPFLSKTYRSYSPKYEEYYTLNGKKEMNDWIKFCKYGQIDDILWVRETWSPIEFENGINYRYKATFVENSELHPKWKPSIFMPKVACRIKLLIKNIRVERLNDISEQDAVYEGIEEEGEFWKSYEIIHSGRHKGEMNPHSSVPNLSAITSYRELWESINGFDSWAKNPWCWVIEFKKL